MMSLMRGSMQRGARLWASRAATTLARAPRGATAVRMASTSSSGASASSSSSSAPIALATVIGAGAGAYFLSDMLFPRPPIEKLSEKDLAAKEALKAASTSDDSESTEKEAPKQESEEPKEEEKKNDEKPATEDDKSESAAAPAQDAQGNLPLAATYVIIGGGTTAFFAVRGIMDRDKNAKVLIISAEEHIPYARTPLSKELWFKDQEGDDFTFTDWGGRARDVFFRKTKFYQSHEEFMTSDQPGVAIINGATVTGIDHFDKILELSDGRSVLYNKCLLATGGRPKRLAMLDTKDMADRTVYFRTLDDYKHLRALSDAGKDVAVIGGGFLGSELSVALATNAKKHSGAVTQIFPESGNMAQVLPEYLCNWTTEKVRSSGVEVRTSRKVVGAKLNDDKVELDLDDGDVVKADYVLVAVGIEPNTELAVRSGLEVDKGKGGVLVNSELEARRDIWAAGDVASFYDISLGRRREEHHDHAAVSGRLAGENMVGARKPYFHQSMFWSDLGPEVGYEAIGIIDSSLRTVGVWAAASEKDTPKAATEAGNIRAGVDDSNPEAASGSESAVSNSATEKSQGKEFGKGVVFYLRDNRVVGVLLWNVFNKIPVARRLIREGNTYNDVSELTKVFRLHDE